MTWERAGRRSKQGGWPRTHRSSFNVPAKLSVVAAALLTTTLTLMALTISAASAEASVIHEPANGLIVPQTATVRFDWAWATDQYASAIYFSQNPDPSLEVWRQAQQTVMRYDSNITIDFGHWTTLDNGEWKNGWAYPLPDGVWYWRLCSKTIYGEDDKCYLESEIRQITLTDAAPPPPPPPPPTACSDGIDNDGDGDTDLVDSYCYSPTGTTEGPLPRKPQCSDGQDNDGDGAIDYPDDQQCVRRSDNLEAPKPLPRLSVWTTKRYIRRSLLGEFEAAYRHGSFKRIADCVRVSRTRVKCRSVSWGIGDLGYRGWVMIWFANDQDGDVSWHYAFRIKRTNGYCVVRKRAGDPGYKSKRCTKIYRAR
jgi:hypothetical protein